MTLSRPLHKLKTKALVGVVAALLALAWIGDHASRANAGFAYAARYTPAYQNNNCYGPTDGWTCYAYTDILGQGNWYSVCDQCNAGHGAVYWYTPLFGEWDDQGTWLNAYYLSPEYNPNDYGGLFG